MTAPVAILFDRLGPYHVARISAAAKSYPVVAIEFARDTASYAWDRVDSDAFQRFTIVTDGRADELSRFQFAQRLFRTLNRVRPSVIALPGWYHYGSLFALCWALRTRTPTVMMSESQAGDEERRWLKERIKRQVLGLSAAALVGGKRHVEYARQLGMADHEVFAGYDVVDNDHFSVGAEDARRNASVVRERLRLRERYFVASSRFIPKKNLPLLLRAYERYRRTSAAPHIKLVLLGDGPMRGELESLRRSLALETDVTFAGFQQYADIPAYYGLAEAFIHASTVEQWGLVVNEAAAAGLPLVVSRQSGCVPELVREGENGHVFDANDEVRLSEILCGLAEDAHRRNAYGQRSRELVAPLSPAFFAAQLLRAAAVARDSARRAKLFDPALPALLALAVR